MNIPTIAMLIAVIVLFGGACFVKNKSLNFLLLAFGYVALLGLGAVVGNSQNNFSGYVVFLLVSIAPQFLNLFDLKAYIASKKQNFSNDVATEEKSIKNDDEAEQSFTSSQPSNQNLESQTEENDTNAEVYNEDVEADAPKEKKHHFLNSKGEFLHGSASLLTAICIIFAGLYVGLETFYGALFGLAAGLAMMFLYLALKKEINPFDLLGVTLSFVAIGLLLGTIITVILYSTSLTNILFCGGCLLLAISIGLNTSNKTTFGNLIYCLATICLFATLLF